MKYWLVSQIDIACVEERGDKKEEEWRESSDVMLIEQGNQSIHSVTNSSDSFAMFTSNFFEFENSK